MLFVDYLSKLLVVDILKTKEVLPIF
jgi:hypothetical protein